MKTGNFEVGVHIADVSYFVEEDNTLDGIASRRATTVYMVQKVGSPCDIFNDVPFHMVSWLELLISCFVIHWSFTIFLSLFDLLEINLQPDKHNFLATFPLVFVN